VLAAVPSSPHRPTTIPLVRAREPGFDSLQVSPQSIGALLQNGALSDEVLYASATAMVFSFSVQAQVAVFNPLVYQRWLDNTDMTDLLPMVECTNFVHRRLALVPIFIFEKAHWIAVGVEMDLRIVKVFDSFANRGDAEFHGGV
jgi:hypothetical protein